VDVLTEQICVSSLRETARCHFIEWDRCAGLGDTKQAKQVRRKILDSAKLALPVAAGDAGGLYAFLDRSNPEIDVVRYVGIAETKARPLRERIVDRFRDDSCFDVALDQLEVNEARILIDRRLRVAMPRTADLTRLRYVDNHIRTAATIRSITHIAFACSSADILTLRTAEKILVSSAWSTSQPLLNVHGRRFQNHVTHANLELAVKAVEAFVSDSELGKLWKAEIVSRFSLPRQPSTYRGPGPAAPAASSRL